MSKTAIEAKRGTHFLVEPHQLTLITDKKHPNYDPRVDLPVSESMVASIRAKGVIEPVIVRKNGDILEVTDGRQRTKNAVEANKRNKAEGAPPIFVPVIIRREDDVEAFETSIVLNEIRENDDVISKVEKANRLLNMGRTTEQVAHAFGVLPTTINAWTKIMDLAPQVRTAIKNGQVGATDAVKQLGSLTREQQIEKLPQLVESAPTRKRQGQSETKKGAKKTSAAVRLRSLYRDEKAVEALSMREQTLVKWLFGEASNGDLAGAIPRLSTFLDSKGKK